MVKRTALRTGALGVLLGAIVIGLPACGGSSNSGSSVGAAPAATADALPTGVAGLPPPRIRLADATDGGMLDTRALLGRAYAVTVDPAHDTRAAVRSWLRVHHEPANFHYLIGDQRELAPVWKGYFAAPQIPGDPQSSHTAAIWFIDAHGRRQALFSAGIPVNPAELAAELRSLLVKA